MDWYEIIAELSAGLALFLFGMALMAEHLKLVAGDGMRRLLGALTTNRFAAAGTGAVVTAVIQSSSVTTVLVVGFITAGLMNMQQSIGIIMGANIGSTVTAQIIAFKITKHAMLMIAIGFAFWFAAKRDPIRHYGALVLGLGLVFYGMHMMGHATEPVREVPAIREWMRQIGPLGGIALGAVFTAIVQSSAATTGIIIVLAAQQLITLEAGIALAFGANIGTCATALLAAIGKPRSAVQAAVVHVLFNVIGVLLWFFLIEQLADLVRGVGDDPARQIANAHTLFNVINTLVLLPFVGVFVWLVQRLVPERPVVETGVVPRHLDDTLLASPDLALTGLRAEIGHIAEQVDELLVDLPHLVARGDRASLLHLSARDDDIDRLCRASLDFARQLARLEMTPRLSNELGQAVQIVGELEGIADIVTSNLVQSGLSRLDKSVAVSGQTFAKLQEYHAQVQDAFHALRSALVERDAQAAAAVSDRKADVRTVHDELERHLTARLVTDDPNRVHAYSVERDLIDHLYRIFSLTKRIAKQVAG